MVNKKALPAGRQGFTLIEILVVIGVLAIIVIVGSTSFFNLLQGSIKTRAVNLVKQNGDYAMGVMTRMIRNARSIEENSDGQTCISGMSRIKIKNPDEGETEFSCNPISSNSAKLISDQITVNNCLFNCQEGGYFNPDVVTIDFTLSVGSPTQPEEFATLRFKTTVVLRNISED